MKAALYILFLQGKAIPAIIFFEFKSDTATKALFVKGIVYVENKICSQHRYFNSL